MSKASVSKKVSQWFFALSVRERMLVSSAAAVLFFFVIIPPIQSAIAGMHDSEMQIARRTREYMDLGSLLKRYQLLASKLKSAELSYQQSQMTFEQVTTEVDKIIKESIGKDDYDLKPAVDAGQQIGADLETREFAVRIPSLTLDQLIQLLFKLESGRSPLFLGKLTVQKSGANLSAELLISTLTKRRAVGDNS